ncbi:AP-3 complex subunit beta-1 [Merluccius polli]|uniref:AP-3 complex subunit beta n=1 Tax=Merluccius polli TaxID=89951 RepID=A0AA47NW49_MERPO|nr:AP-3 complex subunit beta-1 [Merluccius polli]
MLNASNNTSYNDQGGAEAALEAAPDGTSNNSSTGGGIGPAGFGLFSTDFKKSAMEAALLSAENLQLSLQTELSQEEQALTHARRCHDHEEAQGPGNDDLKEMLESNKESLKLEAMKRIVGLIAKGKNASELFPAVVKNVANKNIELKKLVYVYLVRYAEEQQDLALLSISTFQRALKDPNQLIRASALRVLSSIRVPIIVPIMMLAIKESASDMSPYVRKTSAHAIQKLYSLDPDQKEQLIEVIEKLLKDKSTLVAGSVVMAYEEVCPDRIDLIHKNYRKLCNLLMDVEEWGQVVILSMLTRYARTQFTSPWKEGVSFDENNEKAFYDSDSEEKKEVEVKSYMMDPDHRLLLRNTKPLLQSRNTAVVMAVAQLYWHLAPTHEVGVVTKSLGMFEPYLKSFYVRSTDPTHIKTLKLEILTNLANEANISTILREFQTYVKSQDKAFAAATIQAIGRCATDISEVTDTCLNGLVLLLSNRDETVVAESVVVIKKLLQTQPSQHSDIIKHMAKLFDKITVAMARASILWLIGEYCERVPKIAPDVLRKMAKSFTTEEDIVKLQIVNLAAKLYLTNSKQTKLLTQYILNLGKYDQNYDIRDRTRFIRQLIVPNEKSGALSKYARRILLAPKPAPLLQSAFKDRDRFQLGTLSHSLNVKASGYLELSDWPAVAPDQSVRNVEVIEPVKEWVPTVGKAKPAKSEDKFYSDSDGDQEEDQGSKNSSSSSGESSSSSSSSEGSGTEDSDEESSDASAKSSSQSEKSSSESETDQKKNKNKRKSKAKSKTVDSESEENNNGPVASSSSEDSSSSSSESSSDSDFGKGQTKSSSKSKPKVMRGRRVSTPRAVGEIETSRTHTESHTPNNFRPVSQSVSQSLVVSFICHFVLFLRSRRWTPISLVVQVKEGQPKKEVSLLDLDDLTPTALTTPKSAMYSPSLLSDLEGLSLSSISSPMQVNVPTFGLVKSHELLHHMSGKGLSARYSFPRQPFLYQPHMVHLQITLTNASDHPLEELHLGDHSPANLTLHRFNTIDQLEPQASVTVSMGIDFNDSTQAANFQLCTKEDKFSVSIQPVVGELLLPTSMTQQDFEKEQGKLLGMNETSATITMAVTHCSGAALNKQVLSIANLGEVITGQNNVHRFAGRTVSAGALVLVTVEQMETPGATVTVNTDKTVMASVLLKDLKQALASA